MLWLNHLLKRDLEGITKRKGEILLLILIELFGKERKKSNEAERERWRIATLSACNLDSFQLDPLSFLFDFFVLFLLVHFSFRFFSIFVCLIFLLQHLLHATWTYRQHSYIFEFLYCDILRMQPRLISTRPTLFSFCISEFVYFLIFCISFICF